MELNLHPACAAWPTMSEADLTELAASIKQNGLLEPIVVMSDGAILDGRNRALACARAGVEAITIRYEGNDPVRFVIAKNKDRRHQTKSQRALSLARLASLQKGSNQYQQKVDLVSDKTHTSKDLAEQGGLSVSFIDHARTVLRAEPHIVTIVEAGAVSVRVAAEALRFSSPEERANWTAADLQREGRKIINNYPSSQITNKKPTKIEAQPPRPPRFGGPRPVLRDLSREERGMPPEAEMGEQAPGHPPGTTKALAHTMKYGKVQLWSPADAALIELDRRHREFIVAMQQIAASDAFEPPEMAGLSQTHAIAFQRNVRRLLPQVQARLDAFAAALGVLEQQEVG